MASLSHRLMPYQIVAPNQVASREDVLDAGAYKHLEIEFRVINAGSAGNVKIQHAAVNEPEYYIDLTSISAPVNAAGNTHKSVSNFLRYIRWIGDNAVAGGPAMQIDLIAKE